MPYDFEQIERDINIQMALQEQAWGPSGDSVPSHLGELGAVEG